MGLQIAVRFFFINTLPFMTIESDIKTLFDKPFFNPINFFHADFQYTYNLFIC